MSRDLFDTDLEYKRQLIKELIDIAGELGWQIAMPGTEDDDEVDGLIIGTSEFIERVLDFIGDEDLDS